MTLTNRKILFFAHSQSIHTRRWVEYFVSKKWDVHIISFHPKEIEGAHTYYLRAGNIAPEGKNFKFLLKIPRIIFLTHIIKPDLINAHYLTSFGFLAYLTFCKNLSLTLYGSDIFLYSRKNTIYKYFSAKVLHKARHIFSVSENMTNILVSYFKIDPDKITTIQYGIDTSLFKSITPLKQRNYLFLTNRTFVENSNYPVILAVMDKLKRRQIKFKMIIVGEGPMLNDIKSLITTYNLEKNITLLNIVNQKELVGLLNDSQIYLSFTSSDGTPLSLFEAAACGLYPILSDNDANLEWLKRGLIGHSIKVNDQNGIVHTIREVLKNLRQSEYQLKNIEFINKYMSYDQNMSIIEKKMSSLI